MLFNFLPNLDLLILGVTIASNLLLGFIVFFQFPKSNTSRFFLLLTASITVWSIFNYLSYQILDLQQALWIIRLVLVFAIFFATYFFLLVANFPYSELVIKKKWLYWIHTISMIAVFISISPLTFPRVLFSNASPIPQPIVGPGIFIFGFVVLSYDLGGLIWIIWKNFKVNSKEERTQQRFLLIGFLITLLFIIIFNFIFPVILNDTRFIPFAPLFTLPFAILTAYSIIKYNLLNIKIIATEILTFVLAVVSFIEIIIANDPLIIIFRCAVLILTLAFGILLIRSVRIEVEQREKLEQLNKELEAAKVKLEDLSRFKTQLLSLASHQIKSPLAAIKGFISIMLQGLYGPIEPKIRETLEKMKHSSDELIDLINSILDLRKVEEGRMEYTFEKTSLTAMVKGVVEEIQPLATAKGLKLENNLPANEIFVQADKTKLKQVIQNLIDNSIKYTPEGFVRAELKEGGPGAVIFSVTDSGLGLSAELIPQLFSEFVRDERVKKEIRGTGFGLYIAKNIIEAHGGTLSATSPGEGKGSTFSVRLKTV